MGNTKGATTLNKIFQICAILLFKEGHSPKAVADFLNGFVDPQTIRAWNRRYEQMQGFPSAKNRELRRLPLPPIDFSAIQTETLEQLASGGTEPEAAVSSEFDPADL